MSLPNEGLSSSSQKLRVVVAWAAIVLAVFVAYLPALDAGFIWDDDRFLVHNPLIKAPDGLRRIWFTTEPLDYFPLTYTMMWFEWRLWGAEPTGYHAVNILLHALNALLIWRVLRLLAVPGAWIGALIFALHPVCAASVAWITERKNTLSLLFTLLSLWAYLKAEADSDNKAPAALIPFKPLALSAFFLFLLGLLSKTSVATLPIVLLLCAWWRRGSLRRADLIRTAPFFALALAVGLLAMRFHAHGALAGATVRPEGFFSRLAAAGWAAWFYLYKALAPLELLMVYPRWKVDPLSTAAWLPLLALLGTVGLLWSFRWSWGRGLLFALACFLTALLPVLGFFSISFMRHSLVADHWQYPALPCVAAVTGAALEKARRRSAGAQAACWTGVTVCVIIVLGALTWRQAELHQSEWKLWTYNLSKNPACWAGHMNLGREMLARGRVAQAIEHYETAARLQPEWPDSHFMLAVIYGATGNLEKAISKYREVIRLNPRDGEAHSQLADALAAAGRAHEAIKHYFRALELGEDGALLRNNLGRCLAQIGDAAGAIAQYRASLRMAPDSPLTLTNLAWLLATNANPALRNGSEAVRLAQRACELTRSADVQSLDALAAAYAEAGQFEQARQTAEAALARALALGKKELAQFIRLRIELYRAGQPFRERPAGRTEDNLL